MHIYFKDLMTGEDLTEAEMVAPPAVETYVRIVGDSGDSQARGRVVSVLLELEQTAGQAHWSLPSYHVTLDIGTRGKKPKP